MSTPTLDNVTAVKTPKSHAELVSLLTNFNLPVERYGQPGAKSTESIFAKVKKRETTFAEHDGKLYRMLPAVARAFISKTDENGLNYILLENDQGIYRSTDVNDLERELLGDYELMDIVQRKSNWAVWETMQEGEDKDKAMVRGMIEELVRKDPTAAPDEVKTSIHPDELKTFRKYGIRSYKDLQQKLEQHLSFRNSNPVLEQPLEYPDLPTLYTAHTYHFEMQPFLDRAGYATRDEEGKLNVFGWVPADVAREVIKIAQKKQAL